VFRLRKFVLKFVNSPLPKFLMDCWPAATGFISVDDIIVNQCPCMKNFDCGSGWYSFLFISSDCATGK